jgi:hypothetical protein
LQYPLFIKYSGNRTHIASYRLYQMEYTKKNSSEEISNKIYF